MGLGAITRLLTTPTLRICLEDLTTAPISSIFLDMETTTNREGNMTSTDTTQTDLIAQAEKLEEQADNLYAALLAPSMAERAMREDALELRQKAASA